MRLRIAIAVAAVTLLAACGGKGGGDDPAQVFAKAKELLDETPGVHLSIAFGESRLPAGVSGVLRAEGTLTHQPAFEGTIKASLSGLSADIPVVAVDGRVYADVPLLPGGMQQIDPSDYHMPDPAAFADPDRGLSSWLTAATKTSYYGQAREGGSIHAEYHAKLSGAAVKSIIPTADANGTFIVVFQFDTRGRLALASLHGPFYAGSSDVGYTIVLTGYGTTKQIAAP